MLKSIRFDLMVALPALVVASLLGAFSVAHAHNGENHAHAQADVQADVNADGSIQTSPYMPLDEDEDGEGEGGDGTTVDADSNAGVDAGLDAGAGADGSSGDGTDGPGQTAELRLLELNQESAASISITADDGTSMTAAEVSTDEDLRLYAATALQQDSNLEEVEASSDGVSVSYRVPARFLGFIPSSLTAQAHVEGNGAVSIDYPWYRIFFALNDTDAEARLAAEVEALTAGNTSGTISAALSAQLIDRVAAAFSASATASAE